MLEEQVPFLGVKLRYLTLKKSELVMEKNVQYDGQVLFRKMEAETFSD